MTAFVAILPTALPAPDAISLAEFAVAPAASVAAAPDEAAPSEVVVAPAPSASADA